MKNNKLLKSVSILTVTFTALAFSCKDEERITAQDTQDISEEAVTDSYFQDMDDMAVVAIDAPSDEEFGSGRTKGTITVNDNRFRCDGSPLTVTLERINANPDSPSGIITVDFGTSGCEDFEGNVRKGKLVFTYNGRRYVSGSTVVTTGVDYSINGVKLEGTRTLTNVSTGNTPRFTAVLANGKATFEDGSVAERESTITWQWIKAAIPADHKLIIDQSSEASGTTRGGRAYEVSLLEDLTYQRFCGIAVSGIKQYVIEGEKEITIDYGDGTCDRAIQITVNGVTRNISVN
jgi:hypothetical protein